MMFFDPINKLIKELEKLKLFVELEIKEIKEENIVEAESVFKKANHHVKEIQELTCKKRKELEGEYGKQFLLEIEKELNFNIFPEYRRLEKCFEDNKEEIMNHLKKGELDGASLYLQELAGLEELIGKLSNLLDKIKEMKEEGEERFINPKRIIKMNAYNTFLRRYRSHKGMIERVELKIQTFPYNGKTLHGEIKTGRYEGKRHAYLNKPLDDYRIVYGWDADSKILTYLKIGTHKELEIS